MLYRAIFLGLFFSCGLVCSVIADSEVLPLPRFVSIRKNEANLRTGPSERYPIDWKYQKAMIPLEVISEFGHWRRVKDWNGTTGWMKKNLLSNDRTFRTLARVDLLRRPNKNIVVAKLEAGVIGKLMQCPQDVPLFCRAEVQGYQGWIRRDAIWGLYPIEYFE